MSILPVILAGGTGSRLWPLSRELYPKQIINLTGNLSLLQTTLKRVNKIPSVLPPVIVTGEEHRFLVKNQVDELGLFPYYDILLEPMGKNTAPAICGAAFYVRQQLDSDAMLLVLPADHLIMEEDVFISLVEEALPYASQGNLLTFGIVPHAPETGYGYIARGEGNRVDSFVEKPDLVKAKEYLQAGNYFWNSGMFAFSVATVLAEMERYAPDIVANMEKAVLAGVDDGLFFRFNEKYMDMCPSDSIDYALMEKTRRAVVLPADMGWSDIGSWQSLWQVSEKDDHGNLTTGDVLLEDVNNSLIRTEGRMVAAIGLENMMVVDTADAVLVAPLARSQDVKKIVTRLKADKREQFHLHKKVYRPWGSYTVLEANDRFQIKRITVNPGASLSLQMHHHRYEHWVVVSGVAEIVKGEKTFFLQENESVYIPVGTKHRLANRQDEVLELIEVQIGDYLGEDDIVRFDDVYGRSDE